LSFTTDMQAPLSPELEERLNNFNTTKAAYIDAQERFLGITQGNLQLRQQADQLERMADATDASWKKMAASCDGANRARYNERRSSAPKS